MKKVLTALAGLFASIANAQTAIPALSLSDLKPLGFDCRIAMSVDDGTPFFEKTFAVAGDASTQGPPEQLFDAGGGYRLNFMVDSNGFLLTWLRGTSTIAKGLFVWTAGSVKHRVVVLYNPQNDNEQASVNCSLQPPPVMPPPHASATLPGLSPAAPAFVL